ncbi:hypothetical protein F0562_007345 [Nyssa sinensis]|uniref:Retrotransposon gag domain-containing protein n=1 Tax=Nyssa sinensis TaxID=561372 RepID=A0A5J5A4U8_9ASTE|nr:hypothetical protein F0562_007345 [Nyssa sinensis]
MDWMKLGVANKFHHLEETINRLSKALFSNKEGSSCHTHPNDRDGHSCNNRKENRDELDGGQSVFSSKMAKLKFPRYLGDDPTEWFNRVAQFFEYQGTNDAQKVPLASFHLEGEANQLWPSNCENFDEALSLIKQVGSLRDYQQEFERLGNRPRTLKEAISLARMKDDQLSRQCNFLRPSPLARAPLALPPPAREPPTAQIKRLSWDEMQKWRA